MLPVAPCEARIARPVGKRPTDQHRIKIFKYLYLEGNRMRFSHPGKDEARFAKAP